MEFFFKGEKKEKKTGRKTPKTGRNLMILKETGRNRKNRKEQEETGRNRKEQ